MPVPFKHIFIATKNKGKLREFTSLFASLGVQVSSLLDAPELADVEETGSTFTANALLKARTISEWTGLPVLADDSGLCVQRLDDAPGVYSARYGGEHGNDAKNNARLLTELQTITNHRCEHTTDGTAYLSEARFVCVLVLYVPEQEPLIVEGQCRGVILTAARGEGGFGYDPLFYLPQMKKTMAELTIEEKNQVSHRSQALRELIAYFQKM